MGSPIKMSVLGVFRFKLYLWFYELAMLSDQDLKEVEAEAGNGLDKLGRVQTIGLDLKI